MLISFWQISCNPMTLHIVKMKAIKQNQANPQPLPSYSSGGTTDDIAEGNAMRSYQYLLNSIKSSFFYPACLCTDFHAHLLICTSKHTLYWIQRFTREQLASGSTEDRRVYSDFKEKISSHY